ncbi:MAG: acetylglutamate kinase [Evtepia sp.]
MNTQPLGFFLQLLQKNNLLSDGSCFPAMDFPISLISCDSRAVVPGTLFICKGAHFKVEFLEAAAQNGAVAYLAETQFPNIPLPCIPVNDVRRAMALLADAFYDHPSTKLSAVGITGTKGKSSTTYYLKYIFDEFLTAQKKHDSAVISSIDTYDGIEKFESHLTTPEPLDLQRHFSNALQTGAEFLTMEVSSQALKYHRVDQVSFAAAVFLNIGNDHISPVEHPDFEDYFSSKLKIFSQASVACVNLDCEYAGRVRSAAEAASPRVITFSQSDPTAEVFASHIRKSGGDILFHVKTPRYSREFRLTMPGLFNVQNALAALSVCEALDIPEQYAYAGLMKARVPGRMEIYTNANERVTAIVDYAHNGLSFQKLFESVKEEYPDRRIVTVFGCPGKKALDRRHDLGEISGRYSDYVILTEEDSGEEPTEEICRDIAQWVSCDYSIRPDRGEAIRQAVMSCETPTILLITGKGAETRQKRGIEYIDCPSDVDYVKEALLDYDRDHGMDGMSKIRNLLDILPLLRRYNRKTMVIKYGGSALDEHGTVLEDVSALRSVGVNVVLVHGGGAEISALLDRLKMESHFENGYRVTDEAILETAELALSAKVNKTLVGALDKLGARPVGVSGRDGQLITATQKDPALGYVGEVQLVKTDLIDALFIGDFLPVISPIARGEDGTPLNCNADDIACAIAEALRADKLIFLTDTNGILVDSHNRDTRIPKLSTTRAQELLENGLIAGGMIPKTRSCIQAVSKGVGAVTVLDGRIEHAILLDAISEKSIGTTIEKD